MCVCERKRERKREGENRENMTVKQGGTRRGHSKLVPTKYFKISHILKKILQNSMNLLNLYC